MKLAIISLLVCGLVAVYSEPQFYYGNLNFPWPNNPFARKSNDGAEQVPVGDARFFFATQYFTIATSTITSTITSITSCTTSTAALNVCVASDGGRRRRSAAKGSLFYKASESDNIDDIFLPPPPKVAPRAADPVEASKETPATFVPFVIQPGFMGRSEPQFRFLVGLTTATITFTTTTTSVSSLTAICSSTSNLQLCVNSGK